MWKWLIKKFSRKKILGPPPAPADPNAPQINLDPPTTQYQWYWDEPYLYIYKDHKEQINYGGYVYQEYNPIFAKKTKYLH